MNVEEDGPGDVDVHSSFGGVGSRCNAHELLSCLWGLSGNEWTEALDVQVDMLLQSSVSKPASHLLPPHRPTAAPISATVLRFGLHPARSGIASWLVGRWAAIQTACRTPTPTSAAWSCLDRHIGSPCRGP